MPNAKSVPPILWLIATALLLVACDQDQSPAGAVTVQLPPARPYKPATVSPGFSEPLAGAAKG